MQKRITKMMLREKKKKNSRFIVTVMLHKLKGASVLYLEGDITSLFSSLIFQVGEGIQNVVSPEILPCQDSNYR